MSSYSLDDLRVVVTVERTGSFGRAAVELGVAQPSVSGRVRQLERVLGVELFARSRRGARLTTAGEEFAAVARRMLELAEHAQLTVGQAARYRSFVLGVHGTFAPAIVPAVAALLDTDELSLRVRDAHSDELISFVATREVDIAIVVPSPTPASVVLEPLLTAPVICVARPGHPTTIGTTRRHALATSPLAIHAWGDSPHGGRTARPETTQTILRLLTEIGMAGRSACWVSTASTVTTLVRDHDYVGIAPNVALTAEIERGDLEVVDVDDFPRWESLLALACRADRANESDISRLRTGLRERLHNEPSRL